nr:MAG TPA: hypothetical protein [Caudoviricetes sp.]
MFESVDIIAKLCYHIATPARREEVRTCKTK